MVANDTGPMHLAVSVGTPTVGIFGPVSLATIDRKSTRLNSSHTVISYAVFCLEKKERTEERLLALQRLDVREVSHADAEELPVRYADVLDLLVHSLQDHREEEIYDGLSRGGRD